MGIHTADAIVLRRYLFRETSVVLSCLTDRFGKIRGLVKGLRQMPNRYRSAMEPMTISRIVFYDTRSSQIHLISQCDLIAPLSELPRDLDTLRLAALCVELADAVVPLEEPQPAIYRLLKETLESLTMESARQDQLRIHFIVRLLHLAGFKPQLDACTGCDRHIRGPAHWSARQGGLLCRNCLHEDRQAEPALPQMVLALEQLGQNEHPLLLEEDLVPMLNRKLDEFLHWRLDRPLKTLMGQRKERAPEPMLQHVTSDT